MDVPVYVSRDKGQLSSHLLRMTDVYLSKEISFLTTKNCVFFILSW